MMQPNNVNAHVVSTGGKLHKLCSSSWCFRFFVSRREVVVMSIWFYAVVSRLSYGDNTMLLIRISDFFFTFLDAKVCNAPRCKCKDKK